MDEFNNSTSSTPVDDVEGVGEGWDRFVYMFSSIPSPYDDDESEDSSSDSPRDYGGWDIDSDSPFWSFEAIVIFAILAATLLANLYFWFWYVPPSTTASTAKDISSTAEQQPKAPNPSDSEHGKEEEEEEEEQTAAEATAMEEEEEEQIIDPENLEEIHLRNTTGAEAEATTTAANPTTKPRLHYLDNLKVFLVGVVFIQHVAQYQTASLNPSLGDRLFISLVSLNSAWFMQLFFWISAYFVPTSLERKGNAWFLKDKVQRLGLPLLFLSFLLVPFRHWMTKGLTNKPYDYQIQFGVSWFLFWLLIMDVVYVIGCTILPTYHLPQISLATAHNTLVRLGCGIVLGLLQGTIALAQNGRWIVFGSFGVQWCYLPSYICFFVLGIIAKRNHRLVSTSTPSSSNTTTTTKKEQQQPQQQQSDLDDDNTSSNTSSSMPLLLQSILASLLASVGLVLVSFYQDDMSVASKSYLWGLSSGIMTVSFPIIVLTAFQSWGNMTTPWTTFLTRIAYAFYLIHSELIVFPLTLVWIGVLRIVFGEDVQDNDLPNDGWVWLGGVFVSVIGIPLGCVLAWYICKIPGLRTIL